MSDRATMNLSADEVQAWARAAGAMQATSLVDALEAEFGEEWRVAYDSVLLKLSKLENLLGQVDPLTVDEAEAIAIFTSDLDQRRAALDERRRRGA